MTASTDVPTLHAARLAPAVALDLQLESYANGMQAPVWMWMPIFAIVHRRGGEVGFPHSPSAGAALAHQRYMCTPLFIPLFTPFTPLSTPLCPSYSGQSVCIATHGTAVLGTPTARERRVRATLVPRAPQHDVHHSRASPIDNNYI